MITVGKAWSLPSTVHRMGVRILSRILSRPHLLLVLLRLARLPPQLPTLILLQHQLRMVGLVEIRIPAPRLPLQSLLRPPFTLSLSAILVRLPLTRPAFRPIPAILWSSNCTSVHLPFFTLKLKLAFLPAARKTIRSLNRHSPTLVVL